MPVPDPVRRECSSNRVPAAVIDEEFQTAAAALCFECSLCIAERDQHVIRRCGCRFYDRFKGKALAGAGECAVFRRMLHDRVALECMTAVQASFAGAVIPVRVISEDGSGDLCAAVRDLIYRTAAAECSEGDCPGLIDPVPDEAAHHVRSAADLIPVFFQCADGIAHCVIVFTHDIRDLSVAAVNTRESAGARVHVAVHVNAHGVALSFAVDRAGAVMPLKIPDHIPEQTVCEIRIAGIFHFVADRPCNDRGVVLQPLKCSLSPVQTELIEHPHLLLVVAVHQTVAFHVRFCHHVHPVLVAEPVEIGVIAVM